MRIILDLLLIMFFPLSIVLRPISILLVGLFAISSIIGLIDKTVVIFGIGIISIIEILAILSIISILIVIIGTVAWVIHYGRYGPL